MKRVALKRGKPLKRTTRLKVRGKSRFPKRRLIGYPEWVAGFRCCVGYYGLDQDYICPSGFLGSEPAHIKSRGAGGTDAANIVPLCRHHHTEQHAMGIKSFQRKYSIDLRALANHFWQFYQSGERRR